MQQNSLPFNVKYLCCDHFRTQTFSLLFLYIASCFGSLLYYIFKCRCLTDSVWADVRSVGLCHIFFHFVIMNFYIAFKKIWRFAFLFIMISIFFPPHTEADLIWCAFLAVGPSTFRNIYCVSIQLNTGGFKMSIDVLCLTYLVWALKVS